MAYFIYGWHAVTAALKNPHRTKHSLLSTNDAMEKLKDIIPKRLDTQIMHPKDLDRKLGAGAVHQGVALKVSELDQPDISEIDITKGRPLVVLDQVTDPHNVGAILRSACAFNAAAVVVQSRNSPAESSILAKTASGALDLLPYIEVTNLSRTLKDFGKAGVWRIGFDSAHAQPLQDVQNNNIPQALVFGAEGKGLRRLVKENCDVLAKIDTNPAFPSLNVSNAVAVGLAMLS